MKFLKDLFRPDKWTLGTLLDAGGTIGSLALGGVNPLELGGSIPSLLALGGGLAGSGGQQPSYTPGATQKGFDFLTQQDLGYLNRNAQNRYNALGNAASAIDPRNDAVNAGYYQNSLLRNADLTGRRSAGVLRDRGYGSGVADAAMLDARNNATEQGNDYFAMLANPINRAQRYVQQAEIYGNPGLLNTSLSASMGMQTQMNNQRLSDLYYEQNRPATTLESGVGLLGQLAPYLFSNKSSGSAISGGANAILSGLGL